MSLRDYLRRLSGANRAKDRNEELPAERTDGIPSGIRLEKLPGPNRGEYPANFFRDEVVWAPSRKRFALAYSIAEARMNDEAGCVLWGETQANRTRILGNPEGIYACCWASPWCVWLNDDIFVFKVRYFDGVVYVPLVAVHVEEGWAVIPGTCDLNSRPAQMREVSGPFKKQSGSQLVRAIKGST
jgi:hypothetical protein